MEHENNEFRERMGQGNDDLHKAKNLAKELERQNKNLERTVNELGRKTEYQEEEMKELRNQFDGERRKTMANERTLSQLQNDNRNLNNRIRDLERELEEAKRTCDELE